VDRSDSLQSLINAFLKKFRSIKWVPIIATEIKRKNSAAYDEVSSKIIQTCLVLMSESLGHIFNHSVATGTFRLKWSVVKPIHEIGGDKANVPNYRQVSPLTGFSKTLGNVTYEGVIQRYNHKGSKDLKNQKDQQFPCVCPSYGIESGIPI
jgi:hypothetical protein